MDEEGEDLVGGAEVRALVIFRVDGDGVGHPLQYCIWGKRAGHCERVVEKEIVMVGRELLLWRPTTHIYSMFGVELQ